LAGGRRWRERSDVTKIGKYDIVRELGRGAMGIVYEGVDPVIGRKVAIKTIRFDTLTNDREYAETYQRFLREARSAGNLSHPSIVTIYEVGESEGLTYIAMEFIEGESLEARIAAGRRIPLDAVIALIAQLADALDYAHRHGIVHRDIKPANILIDRDERPRLVDFGIARVASSSLTQTNAVLGTPYYMAPEQIAGQPIDHRADLFALGTVLYEMLTLTKPFAGANVTTVIYKIMHVDPQPPREIDHTLPAGLDVIMRTALAKNPEQRFQSGRELTLALRTHREAIGQDATAGADMPAVLPSATIRIQAVPAAAAPAPVAEGALPAVPRPPAAPAAPPTMAPGEAPVPAVLHPPPIDAVPPAAPIEPPVPLPPAVSAQPAAPATPAAKGARPAAPVQASATDVRRKRLLAVVGAMMAVVAIVIVALLVAFRTGSPPQAKPGEGGDSAAATEPATPAVPAPSATTSAAPAAVPPPPAAAGGTVPPADPARAARPAVPAAVPTSPPGAGRAGKPAVVAGQGAAPPRTTSKPAAPATELPQPPPLPPSEAPSSSRPAAPTGRIYQMTEVDVKPAIVTTAPPVYPAEAARRRVEDVVVVKALVGEDGRVTDVQVLRGSSKDAAFDAAAIKAVRDYRFTPAQKKGKPVPCWFNLGVPFQMK
jgi:TonB family protein